MADNKQKSDYVRVNVPAAFVHPYTFTDKEGINRDAVIVNIPPGTKIGGQSLRGYSLSRLQNQRMKEQQLNGEAVTLSFKADEPVKVWKGEGEEREELNIKNPWHLASGIKQANEKYKEEKAAERAAVKAEERSADAPVAQPKERKKERLFGPGGRVERARAKADELNKPACEQKATDRDDPSL